MKVSYICWWRTYLGCQSEKFRSARVYSRNLITFRRWTKWFIHNRHPNSSRLFTSLPPPPSITTPFGLAHFHITQERNQFLFQGYADDQWTDGDEWHYVNAYKAFKEMYPRISTGSPLDPWRLVHGDVHETRTQKTCRLKCLPTCFEMASSWQELEPLHLDAITPKNERAFRSDKARESSVWIATLL